MKEVLLKEISYAKNDKAKENLKEVYIYLLNLERVIYKIKECLILTDEELEVYKSIGKSEDNENERGRSL